MGRAPFLRHLSPNLSFEGRVRNVAIQPRALYVRRAQIPEYREQFLFPLLYLSLTATMRVRSATMLIVRCRLRRQRRTNSVRSTTEGEIQLHKARVGGTHVLPHKPHTPGGDNSPSTLPAASPAS